MDGDFVTDLGLQVIDLQWLTIKSEMHATSSTKTLVASTECGPAASRLKDQGTEIQVETVYKLSLKDDSESNTLLAEFTTKMLVVLESDRAVSLKEAEEGNLKVAQDRALEVSHSYHRSKIMEMTAQLGFPPYKLPITIEQVLSEFVEGGEPPSSWSE